MTASEIRLQHERIALHGLRRPFGDLLAEVQHRHPIGDLHDEIHVVLDEHDRHAARADTREELTDPLGLGRVQAGDGLIDYTQFDTLACVSQQVDGPPLQRAWPYANGGTFTTREGNRMLGVISMPNECGVVGNREIFDTFSHELGHNLGLGDQYAPSVAGRNLGSWEMMDWDDPMPHFTIAHRLMLGWVQAG